MTTFSERIGINVPRSHVQHRSMDDRLRMELWNATYLLFFSDWDSWHRHGYLTTQGIWLDHFHNDAARMPDNPTAAERVVRDAFFDAEWWAVYDLLQVILDSSEITELDAFYDKILAKELAGCRIVDGLVVEISDDTEVEELEAALHAGHRFAGARHALTAALRHYSDREAPDYANSIKESISAVESVARTLTGKPNLGDALNELGRTHAQLHPALLKGWKSLYGYSSDAPSIRHGAALPPDVSQELSRYFLVSSAAFVNYLIASDLTA